MRTEPSASLSNKNLEPISSVHRLHAPPTDPLSHKQHMRYDANLFHKTIFHLKPLLDNPELFTRDHSLSSKALGTLKDWRPMDVKAIIPHPVTMKLGLSSL